MNFPEYTRKYLLHGLAATPDVFEKLLKGIGSGDPVWDFTRDPERFTLRGVVAHVADFEEIFRGRMLRTRDEDEPHTPDVDEGQIAIENDYPAIDPIAGLARFRAGRIATVHLLADLSPEAWGRVAIRGFGPITLLNQAVLMLGHDGYHTQQVAKWLEAAGK